MLKYVLLLKQYSYFHNFFEAHWSTKQKQRIPQSEHCNGYPWIFFQRFLRSIHGDFQLNSFEVIGAIHEKIEKIQNISVGDLSENLQYLKKCSRKFFAGISAEMDELSGDMHLVDEYLVWEEIFSIYPMSTHGYPWVIHVLMDGWWADPCKALTTMSIKFKIHSWTLWFWTSLTLWYALFLLFTPVKYNFKIWFLRKFSFPDFLNCHVFFCIVW
jgi:hypothetical protein